MFYKDKANSIADTNIRHPTFHRFSAFQVGCEKHLSLSEKTFSGHSGRNEFDMANNRRRGFLGFFPEDFANKLETATGFRFELPDVSDSSQERIRIGEHEYRQEDLKALEGFLSNSEGWLHDPVWISLSPQWRRHISELLQLKFYRHEKLTREEFNDFRIMINFTPDLHGLEKVMIAELGLLLSKEQEKILRKFYKEPEFKSCYDSWVEMDGKCKDAIFSDTDHAFWYKALFTSIELKIPRHRLEMAMARIKHSFGSLLFGDPEVLTERQRGGDFGIR